MSGSDTAGNSAAATGGDLRDGDLHLVPTSGSPEFTGFAVHRTGDRIGTVALRHETADTASVRWNLRSLAAMDSARAVRLLIEYAFDSMGLARIETRIAADDGNRIRIASMAGIRREGLIRNGGAGVLLMGRLASDPPPYGRDGFTAILNAGLPTKRVISQGIVRDDDGRVLLCELTYKTAWDLPGGVVEVGEAPEAGLVRELTEELDRTFTPRGLLTVNWLPAWRGWDDACVFVFDLGTIRATEIDTMRLQQTEIRAVHWCTPDDVRAYATEATVELLEARGEGPLPNYREAPPFS